MAAHEEHEETHDDHDPLAFYREQPWYTVVHDRWWVFGEAREIVPVAALPTQAYRSAWEMDADGDWVVWIDQTRPGGDLFAYNLDAEAGLYVTDDDAQQHNPSVRGNIVAWEDYRDGQSEIYYFDLDRGDAPVRVTNSTASQRDPVVGDGWIAFEDRSDLANGTDLWIHHLADGVTKPLVQRKGEQVLAAFAADHVLFRDELYGQNDIMAVRVGADTPFYLTRDMALESAPFNDGANGLFLKSNRGSWSLVGFDGLRNRTFSTNYEFDVSAKLDVDDGVAAYTTYKSGGRFFLSVVNLANGRYARITDDMPLRGDPLMADGRIVLMLAAGDEKNRTLLVIEPSRYTLNLPPRMVIDGPPDGAPFTGPRFTANGTYRGNPVWGEPLRFEYRFGNGNWTAFDATDGHWDVVVEVPRGFQIGEKTAFQVRAVYAASPPIQDASTIEFVRLALVERVTENPPEPLLEKVKRVFGAIVLGVVALVFLALLLVRMALRGTFKRWFVRRVDAEYLRPDEPAAPTPAAARGARRP